MTSSTPPSPSSFENLPYRPCVGLMIVNRAGLVFVGRRIDQTLEGWQMPQGGIDEGETPILAAFREMKEEIGTDKARLMREREGWLDYDLPRHLLGVALHGKYRGQTQKWVALRFEGADSDIDLATPEPEFAHWQWVALDELPRMVVPFKRDIYQRVIADFSDLAVPE